MTTRAQDTESVVRNHLRIFLEQRGVPAILEDYDDEACLQDEAKVYRGKKEIGEFFTGFLAALPPGAIERFALRTLRTEGKFAYLTWSAGADIPLGADTFVVRAGKIVSQTVAMYAVPRH